MRTKDGLRTGGEILIDQLAIHGVRHMFCVPGESYIAAKKHEGWVCLPEKYDDGGFTVGNLERPAMQKLLTDIEAGKVDCVVS